MAQKSWLGKLADSAAGIFSKKSGSDSKSGINDRGMLVFQNTSEVIAAERALRDAGLDVEVKGPPPNLQTGCDMVVVFPVLKLAAVKQALAKARLEPEKILSAADVLLEPVSLYHVKELDHWLMARAANMKITIDKRDGKIVNISGGGCPDVPWLAQQYDGKNICDVPEPISIGHTLCCYSMQKAYEELLRRWKCGS